MSVETHRVAIGACGWKHSAWLEDFYSEDLPEDWQLGFYSNEFSIVYIAANDWIEEDLSEWSEDVAESFRFILELPADICSHSAELERLLTKAESLSEFCLGFVLPLQQENCTKLEQFLSCFQTINRIAPTSIDKRGVVLNNEMAALFELHSIAEVWNGVLTESNSDDAESLGLMRNGLAITRVSGEDLDMASLRKVIEVSLQASNENCVSVLCIDGNPPSIEMLRNADIILNLL